MEVQCWSKREEEADVKMRGEVGGLRVEYQSGRTLLPYQVVDRADFDSFWGTLAEAAARMRKVEERRRSGFYEDVPFESEMSSGG